MRLLQSSTLDHKTRARNIAWSSAAFDAAALPPGSAHAISREMRPGNVSAAMQSGKPLLAVSANFLAWCDHGDLNARSSIRGTVASYSSARIFY
jgi:hypothetical protein